MAYFYEGVQQSDNLVNQILTNLKHSKKDRRPYSLHDEYKMQPKLGLGHGYQPMNYHPGRPN